MAPWPCQQAQPIPTAPAVHPLPDPSMHQHAPAGPCSTHLSPIQPGLQCEHLPLIWLQVWPSLQGGQSFSQPSP